MILFTGIIFWCCLILLFYTYLGYGILMFILLKMRKWLGARPSPFYSFEELPEVTVVVAAYNEADLIGEKIRNSLQLRYPPDRAKFIFVTDGSNDGTTEIVMNYPEIITLHQPQRQGKIKAMHRAMQVATTPIVVFTDANTMINEDALVNLVRHYKDQRVGAVAGEKRIWVDETDKAAGAGEGIYWKYESMLKKWDSELYSVVGAAGELFSIRKELYAAAPPDTIIEDFYLTLTVAKNGRRVAYEPEAWAVERGSASVGEEMKRKIRIAAGGLQAIVRLRSLLNIFRYGTLSFQYISHRVLRWTLAPLSLPLILASNIVLAPVSAFYRWTLALQVIFYCLALTGAALKDKKIRWKLLFIPYYFFMMNYSVYAAFFRFKNGKQSVLWEKAKRSPMEGVGGLTEKLKS